MTIAYDSNTNVQSGTASSVTLTWAGTAASQCRFVVFGFEGVTSFATSGKVSTAPAGWSQVLYVSASVSGGSNPGLEVWLDANPWTTGTTSAFTFTGSLPFVARGVAYSGVPASPGGFQLLQSLTGGGTTGTSANPSQNQTYYIDQLGISIIAGQFNAAIGTPTITNGFVANSRFDDVRGGVQGNIEIALADWGPETSTSNVGISETATWTGTIVGTKQWAAGCCTLLAHDPQARIYFQDPVGGVGDTTNPTKTGQAPSSGGVNACSLQSHADGNVGNGWFNVAAGTVFNYAIFAGNGSFQGGISSSTTVLATGSDGGGSVAIVSSSVGDDRVRVSSSINLMSNVIPTSTLNAPQTQSGMDAIITFVWPRFRAQII